MVDHGRALLHLAHAFHHLPHVTQELIEILSYGLGFSKARCGKRPGQGTYFLHQAFSGKEGIR